MTNASTPDWEYIKRKGDWVALWEVIADPVRFATKFNTTIPGAYRSVSAEEIRHMSHCDLIGHRGFYTQEDFEIIRGILRDEQLREHAAEHKREIELVHSV